MRDLLEGCLHIRWQAFSEAFLQLSRTVSTVLQWKQADKLHLCRITELLNLLIYRFTEYV